jgi:multicomponent Na+:H+ antiporter subunit G
MRTGLVDLLLGLSVASAWLGAFGFLRLRSPLDRMHCVAFVFATAGLFLVAAAFVSDGVSSRAGKLLVLVMFGLVSGAALSHLTGRTLLLRGTAPDAAKAAGIPVTPDGPPPVAGAGAEAR